MRCDGAAGVLRGHKTVIRQGRRSIRTNSGIQPMPRGRLADDACGMMPPTTGGAASDPTIRAAFAEDSAALIGLVIAAVGLGAHQLTPSSTPMPSDRFSSASCWWRSRRLVDRNREFLIGEEAADPRMRTAAIRTLP
jgi:hypothetical protein